MGFAKEGRRVRTVRQYPGAPTLHPHRPVITAVLAATAGAAPVTDALVAPSAGLTAAAAIGAYAVKQWKEGRQIDAEGERRRREDAERRADAAERASAGELANMRAELDRVRAEVAELRQRHDKELAELRARRETDLRENYRLRELLSRHGIDPDKAAAT